MSGNNRGQIEAAETGWIEAGDVAVHYNPSTETYRTVYDRNRQESLTMTVLTAVSAVAGVDETALPPLFDTVSPDALEGIFEPTQNSQRSRGRLTIPYAGFLVTIHADGEITLQRLDNNTENQTPQ
jgi:hypothetical protein